MSVLAFGSGAMAQSSSSADTTRPQSGAEAPLAETGNDAVSMTALYAEALLKLRAAADGGDAGAALALANYLVGEEATEEDQADILRYLQQAADAGIIEAQFWLADIYRYGQDGTDADPAKAAVLYEAAAAKGDSYAGVILAQMLLDGTLPVDREKARQVLQAALAEGNPAAPGLLGKMLIEDGEGVAAEAMLSRGMLLQDMEALALLGDLFRNGTPDVPADLAKAVVLYEAAAEQGDIASKYKLAEIHLVGGGGLVASFEKATALLTEIAESDDPTAYLRLGELLLDSSRAGYDPRKAAEAFELAAETGNVEALVALGNLFRNGVEGLAPSATKAIPYFEEAADAGDNSARKILADMLIKGEGFAIDKAQAAELLEEAADAGDEEAAKLLGDLNAGN